METDRPTVSVVVAAKNEERYIGDCLESLLEQTYPHLNIVVVNDNSADETQHIVGSYDSPRIRIVEIGTRPDDTGLGWVRDIGVRTANGELIAICDADDIRYPTSIEQQVQAFEDDPAVGLVGTLYDEINPNGKIIKDRNAESLEKYTGYEISEKEYRDETGWRHGLGGAPSDILRHIILNRKGSYSCPLAPTTTMFRKRIYNQVDGYGHGWKYHVDIRLHRRMAEVCEIRLLDQVLAGWRQHSDRMSIKKWRKEL